MVYCFHARQEVSSVDLLSTIVCTKPQRPLATLWLDLNQIAIETARLPMGVAVPGQDSNQETTSLFSARFRGVPSKGGMHFEIHQFMRCTRISM
jgi:hypothetical protein